MVEYNLWELMRSWTLTISAPELYHSLRSLLSGAVSTVSKNDKEDRELAGTKRRGLNTKGPR